LRRISLCTVSLAVGLIVGYALWNSGAGEHTSQARGHWISTSSTRVEGLGRIPGTVPHIWTGRLTGKVLDVEGRPVPGVRMSVYPLPPDPRNAIDPDIEQAIQNPVGQWHGRSVVLAEAVTDDAGAFVISNVMDGPLLVVAAIDGYEVECDTPPAGEDVFAGTDLLFKACPVGRVSLSVVLSDGSVPASAKLTVLGDGFCRGEEWTPAAPTLQLPVGEYRVSAAVFCPNGECSSREYPIAVTTTHAVTVTVEANQTLLRGTVIVPGARPAPGLLKAYALPLGDGPPSTAQLISEGAEADVGDGTFIVFGLVPGRYSVGVATAGGTLLASRVVAVGLWGGECDFEVTLADVNETIRVRVEDPDGVLLRDVNVTGGTADASRQGIGVLQRDGTFMLLGQPGSQADARRYVEVDSRHYGKTRLYYRSGRELVVRYQPPASLAVSFPANSSDRRGLWACLLGREGFVVVSSHDLSEERFLLGPVPAGTYLLLVVRSITASGSIVLARQSVELAAGQNVVDVVSPGRSSVVVTGMTAYAHARLVPEHKRRWNGLGYRVGEDGRLALGSLPHGRYVLFSEHGAMALHVEGPLEVVFEGRPPDALEVSIKDPDSSLGRLGFSDGDLVVGVNGQRFDGDYCASWSEAMRAVVAKLIVARSGEETLVVVQTVDLRSASAGGGGVIEPTLR